MSTSITRKTYYALGLLAAACGLAAAIGGLAGTPLSPMESVSFALTGMMFLLLAAVKGSPAVDKKRYFLCFLLTLAANVRLLADPLPNYLLMALPWPVFAVYEQARGNAVERQQLLLVFSEILAMLLRVLSAFGIGPFASADWRWLYYMAAAMAEIARGWLCMVLYRLQAVRQNEEGNA